MTSETAAPSTGVDFHAIKVEDVVPSDFQKFERLAKGAHAAFASDYPPDGYGFTERLDELEAVLMQTLHLVAVARKTVGDQMTALLRADESADLDSIDEATWSDQLLDSLAPVTELNSWLVKALVASMSEERLEQRYQGEVYGSYILPSTV